MPRIAEFFGIVIYMYYRDHAPPHFHAIYGQFDAEVGMQPIRVLEGTLPRRVQSMVFEWAAVYQEELLANWQLARSGEPLLWIPPLD